MNKEGARVLELHRRGQQWVETAKQQAQRAHNEEVRAWRAEGSRDDWRRRAILLGLGLGLSLAAGGALAAHVFLGAFS